MRNIGIWIAIAFTSGCQRQSAEGVTAENNPQPAVMDAGAQASPPQGETTTASTSTNIQGASELSACAPESVFETMTAKLVEQADVNGDGRLSREEVDSTANLLVGGFFFAADANGDGVVSVEEGRTARAAVFKRVPVLGAILSAARTATGRNPLASVAKLLDLEYGKPLTSAEARTTAHNVTQEMFEAGDQNGDGTLTQEEIRRAELDSARSLGRSAFAAADRNSDGQLSVDELKDAFVQSTQAVFRVSDTDNNGKLSEREGASALQAIGFWYDKARGEMAPASASTSAATGTVAPARATAGTSVPAPNGAPGAAAAGRAGAKP